MMMICYIVLFAVLLVFGSVSPSPYPPNWNYLNDGPQPPSWPGNWDPPRPPSPIQVLPPRPPSWPPSPRPPGSGSVHPPSYIDMFPPQSPGTDSNNNVGHPCQPHPGGQGHAAIHC
uniref:Neural Wiskott-Aldrich syndrome protein-like isoform X2 n=1 Tax=Crassostrea virginica TaxID=6565 RepID=A0A8B8EGK1_CRAVI|nr:neural Wiskott-Aldrich syndrome protein-like isoform X2 [Crassostrea virginica]